MRDKVVYRGEVSCFCPKCHSKNVYYLQQKQVVLPISPNGNLIHNEKNGGWHSLRTQRERHLMYSIAWNNAETQCLHLVCRDCGTSEQVKD